MGLSFQASCYCNMQDPLWGKTLDDVSSPAAYILPSRSVLAWFFCPVTKMCAVFSNRGLTIKFWWVAKGSGNSLYCSGELQTPLSNNLRGKNLRPGIGPIWQNVVYGSRSTVPQVGGLVKNSPWGVEGWGWGRVHLKIYTIGFHIHSSSLFSVSYCFLTFVSLSSHPSPHTFLSSFLSTSSHSFYYSRLL